MNSEVFGPNQTFEVSDARDGISRLCSESCKAPGSKPPLLSPPTGSRFHPFALSETSWLRSTVERRESDFDRRRGRIRTEPMVGRSCGRVEMWCRRKINGPKVGTQATKIPAVISAMINIDESLTQYIGSWDGHILVWTMRARLIPAVLCVVSI